MTFTAGDAHIVYEQEISTILLSGSMRLANMKEYDQVSAFLKETTQDLSGPLTLDFENLQFLNSSGITTLSLFILWCKKNGQIKLTVKGSKAISWQQKSLSNFKKLWSEVTIDM